MKRGATLKAMLIALALVLAPAWGAMASPATPASAMWADGDGCDGHHSAQPAHGPAHASAACQVACATLGLTAVPAGGPLLRTRTPLRLAVPAEASPDRRNWPPPLRPPRS